MVNRFSDRIGVTKAPALAVDEMSAHLGITLWNVANEFLFRLKDDDEGEWRRPFTAMYVFLHWELDELTWLPAIEQSTLKQWWFAADRRWYEIYNLVEFLATRVGETDSDREDFAATINITLQLEGSPYRFVGDTLTRITSAEEIDEVDEALKVEDEFAGARSHIAKALEFLGRRPEADYRNSISESILSVESTLKVLTGLEHADLADALREFAKAHPIHGALFSGLDKLYGYTSNEHGLRHALLEADAKVGFAEAKFMVVACAAFMNFLIAKSAE
jgi:hypothetical protein